MLYKINKSNYRTFEIFEDKRLKHRGYFIPFSSCAALGKTDYKSERYNSDRVQVLSGEWDFIYYEKDALLADELDTDKIKFSSIPVPATWQRNGYDQIAYINQRYAFKKNPPFIPKDVPVGVYRKKFNIDRNNCSRILTFLGVAGGMDAYINGKHVGYSETAHNSAEFDITDCLKEGENELVVTLHKWSNGTYLECQDMFRENGIFRDVYITERASVYINDYDVKTAPKDGNYDLSVTVSGVFTEKAEITLQVYDGAKKIAETNLQNISGRAEALFKSLKVKDWSAEIPNLYKLIISVTEEGEEKEAVRAYVGFKHISIDGEVFKFNGKPIKIKGVNHHDTHMTRGYAMYTEDIEKDIVLMKDYNCNAVRTSHYPPDPILLAMCDHYGLYVIDEADIETHGFYAVPHTTYRPNRLSNDLSWKEHYLDRVKGMYMRDKSHPSVIMWSLGNESGGYKCQDYCYDYIKSVCPEVPVHYEGVNRSKRWAYDVVSSMYPSQMHTYNVAKGTAGEKYRNKPYFLCEYAHAMGVGPGALEEYMQIFLNNPIIMGGCIWEWVDHAVYDKTAKYKWTYGGDHNEPIHDGKFCVDGLFFPDRTPSSGALNMKAVYRPVRAKMLYDNSFELWNTNAFKDSSDIEIKWYLTKNGRLDAEGTIKEIIAPSSRYTAHIPYPALDNIKDWHITFVYTRLSDSLEIAREQIAINNVTYSAKVGTVPAGYCVTNDKITVNYNAGQAVFNRNTGELTSYKKNGVEYINGNPISGLKGLQPEIYRGATDNDKIVNILWRIVGLHTVKPVLKYCKLREYNGIPRVCVKYSMRARGAFPLYTAYVDYAIDSNGRIMVDTSLKKFNFMAFSLPRFGLAIEMPSEFNLVKYYGRGDNENYSDFNAHSTIGIYQTTVKDMGHKYIKPQDSGNRSEVRYAEFTRSDGQGLRISAADKYLNVKAAHYTLGQLVKARHIEDIPDADTTSISVDGYVRGIGTGSCGPGTLKKYTINISKPLYYSFVIEPMIVKP